MRADKPEFTEEKLLSRLNLCLLTQAFLMQ
jgi:hypothetical protein